MVLDGDFHHMLYYNFFLVILEPTYIGMTKKQMVFDIFGFFRDVLKVYP